ncbi:TPA: hypothetical protein ACWSLE_005275 [Escherichia coli]
MNVEESEQRWVCACCIGEEFLRHKVEKEGRIQTCDYCDEIHTCFSLEEVCDLTEKAIEAHFYRTDTEPNDMEYASLRHIDGYEWFREGENVVQCVFRSIRSRIGIEVRSAIRIHSINRELNFFYRFLTRFFAAFHYRGIFPQ